MQSKHNPKLKNLFNKKAAFLAAFLGLSFLINRIITGSVCIIMSTYGLPCPACGLTRAYGALLRFEVLEALWWHPLFWFVPIIFGVALYKYVFIGKNNPKWFKIFIWGSLVVFIAVYAVRLILYFPHTEPMTLNPLSYAQRIFFFILGFFK